VSEVGPSSPAHHHRRAALRSVPTWVITVSDTRSLQSDSGGARVIALLEDAGHAAAGREIVPDDAGAIRAALERALAREEVSAVVLTGGTGIAPRDVTPDAIEPLLERVIPGFGELFRALSFREIGSAAMLSRALAGIAAGRPVFALPGSRGAIELAMQSLVIPELGHLAAEARKRG
jgi:molybdopterin adenylyltransferase